MLAGNMWSVLGIFIRSFSRRSLTENDGRGSVYLDGWGMGSNPGVKSRFYRERPTIKTKHRFTTEDPEMGSLIKT